MRKSGSRNDASGWLLSAYEAYSYQGECANIQLPTERTSVPDVLGWLHTRACAADDLPYSSDCVWGQHR